MTTSVDARPTATGVREAVRSLLPEIRERAAEIETARRVPLDLVDRLRAAGAFGVLLPASHGGVDGDLTTAMALVEELGGADASTAWIVLVGGGTWLDLAGLPRPTFDEVYARGAATVVAGVFNPTGTATPTADGFAVDGRWTFASGCEHADWLYGNCIDASDAGDLRTVVLRPDEVTIEHTWRVVGLCGTGSHDLRVDGITVPAERTARVLADDPCVDSPWTRIPVPAALALLMSAVPLGIARAALDDVTALATGKVPLLDATTLADQPRFQYTLAEADAQLRAVRARLFEVAAEAWATAVEGRPFEPELRGTLRSSAVVAVSTAEEVVTAAFRAAGSTAIHLDFPLQRRLRDVLALGQHFLVRPDTLVTCGAILAGREPELTIF